MIHGQPRLNIVVCVLVKLASLYFFLSLCIFGSIVILLFHIESLRSISRLVLRTRIADSVYRDDGNACNQKL